MSFLLLTSIIKISIYKEGHALNYIQPYLVEPFLLFKTPLLHFQQVHFDHTCFTYLYPYDIDAYKDTHVAFLIPEITNCEGQYLMFQSIPYQRLSQQTHSPSNTSSYQSQMLRDIPLPLVLCLIGSISSSNIDFITFSSTLTVTKIFQVISSRLTHLNTLKDGDQQEEQEQQE